MTVSRVGVLASILGTFLVGIKNNDAREPQVQKALDMGNWGAIFLTIKESRRAEKRAEKSARPHVRIHSDIRFAPSRFDQLLENDGLGPAIIRKVSYYFD